MKYISKTNSHAYTYDYNNLKNLLTDVLDDLENIEIDTIEIENLVKWEASFFVITLKTYTEIETLARIYEFMRVPEEDEDDDFNDIISLHMKECFDKLADYFDATEDEHDFLTSHRHQDSSENDICEALFEDTIRDTIIDLLETLEKEIEN